MMWLLSVFLGLLGFLSWIIFIPKLSHTLMYYYCLLMEYEEGKILFPQVRIVESRAINLYRLVSHVVKAVHCFGFD